MGRPRKVIEGEAEIEEAEDEVIQPVGDGVGDVRRASGLELVGREASNGRRLEADVNHVVLVVEHPAAMIEAGLDEVAVLALHHVGSVDLHLPVLLKGDYRVRGADNPVHLLRPRLSGISIGRAEGILGLEPIIRNGDNLDAVDPVNVGGHSVLAGHALNHHLLGELGRVGQDAESGLSHEGDELRGTAALGTDRRNVSIELREDGRHNGGVIAVDHDSVVNDGLENGHVAGRVNLGHLVVVAELGNEVASGEHPSGLVLIHNVNQEAHAAIIGNSVGAPVEGRRAGRVASGAGIGSEAGGADLGDLDGVAARILNHALLRTKRERGRASLYDAVKQLLVQSSLVNGHVCSFVWPLTQKARPLEIVPKPKCSDVYLD